MIIIINNKITRGLVSIYIWIIAFCVFVVFVVVNTVFLQIFKPKNVYPVNQALIRFFFRAIFVKVIIEYAEKLEKNKSYLYMPNHVSFLDVMLVAAFFPGYTIGIEASGHFKWPIVGMIFRLYGNIPINRSSPQSSLKSLKTAEEKLKTGVSVVIFPEGTRTRTGKLLKFKKMPFMLAKAAITDMVPVGFSGVQDLSPKGSIWIKPCDIVIKFGKKISKQELETIDIESLMDKTRTEIINLCNDDIV